jgi:hypothetical protein
MMQWKIPSGGASMKTAGGGDVYMNPQRDIAHAFNQYVLSTFAIVTNPECPLMKWYYDNGGKEEDLVLGARFFRKFMENTALKVELGKLTDISKESGYNELPILVRLVVGHAFMNVVLSAYFHGFRECHSKPCDPGIELVEPKQYGPVKRGLRKLLRALLIALD